MSEHAANFPSLIWQEAEDSFLSYFCEITRHPWGSTYYWKSGEDWPKFNFLRVTNSALSPDQFDNICQQFRPWFLEKKRTFSIKVSTNVSLSAEIMARLKFMNSAVIFLRYLPPKRELNNDDGRLYRCQNAADLEMWWDVNSDGRTRLNQSQSPLWPVMVNAFHAGTQFFTLCVQNTAVAGCALTPFGQAHNLWGLATRKEHQQKGHMAELVRLINGLTREPVYLQVLEGSITHRYFSRAYGAEELCNERRYELAE